MKEKYGQVWVPALAANPKLIEDRDTLERGINTLKEEMKMNNEQIAKIIKFFPLALNRNTQFNFT